MGATLAARHVGKGQDMPEDYRRGSELIGRMLAEHSLEELGQILAPRVKLSSRSRAGAGGTMTQEPVRIG